MVHSTQELVIFCAFFGKPLKDLKQRIDLITKKCFRYLSCTYFIVLLAKKEKLETNAIGSPLYFLLIYWHSFYGFLLCVKI